MRNQEPVAVAIEVASKATLPFLTAINQAFTSCVGQTPSWFAKVVVRAGMAPTMASRDPINRPSRDKNPLQHKGFRWRARQDLTL